MGKYTTKTLVGQPIFKQIIKMIPQEKFDGLVLQEKSDKGYRTFFTWEQLVVMLWGIFSRCDSMGEMCDGMQAPEGKLNYLEMDCSPAYVGQAKKGRGEFCRILCIRFDHNSLFFRGWDADVVIPREQIIDAVEQLRQGYEIAYPYDGRFYDTTDIVRELFLKTNNINILIKNQPKMSLIYGSQMKGGAIFVNRTAYMAAGMENEKFYGWGPEDFERYSRWKILEFKIHQSKGVLYHLTHGRGSNSTFRSMEQKINSDKESLLIKMCTKEELKELHNFSFTG